MLAPHATICFDADAADDTLARHLSRVYAMPPSPSRLLRDVADISRCFYRLLLRFDTRLPAPLLPLSPLPPFLRAAMLTPLMFSSRCYALLIIFADIITPR